jgi:two-component system, response regulator PdtaR
MRKSSQPVRQTDGRRHANGGGAVRYNVLIVARQPETAEHMSGILASLGYQVTDTCTTGMQALRSAGNRPCDIAIVGFSLPDMTGLAFAEDLHDICSASVLLLVPPEQMSYARQSVGDLDISCLARPVSAAGLAASLEMIMQFRERYRRMQDETKKLTEALERRNLADKAKAALMKGLGLAEADAWRQMQKQSMDTGKPMEHVARHILDIYGTKDR